MYQDIENAKGKTETKFWRTKIQKIGQKLCVPEIKQTKNH